MFKNLRAVMMMIKKETWKIQMTVSGKSLDSETRRFLVVHHEWKNCFTYLTLQPIVALETVRLALYHKPALISKKKDSCVTRQKTITFIFAFHVFARGLSRPKHHPHSRLQPHLQIHPLPRLQLPSTTCCQVVMSGGSFVCRNKVRG